MRNNYDTNSEGINIQGFAMYDSDAAQFKFRDTLERLAEDVYFYTDHGNRQAPDGMYEVKRTEANKKALIEYFVDWQDSEYKWSDWDEAEAEYLEAEAPTSFHEINKGQHGELCTLKDGYEIHHVRGYSQGDYVLVFAHEGETDSESLQKLIFDQPIRAEVDVNGAEYCYWDLMPDKEYEWDKAGFIEKILESLNEDLNKSKVKAYLKDVLPDEPEYN